MHPFHVEASSVFAFSRQVGVDIALDSCGALSTKIQLNHATWAEKVFLWVAERSRNFVLAFFLEQIPCATRYIFHPSTIMAEDQEECKKYFVAYYNTNNNLVVQNSENGHFALTN